MNALKIGLLFVWIAGVGIGLSLSTTGVATEPDAPDVAAPPPAAITVVGQVEVMPAASAGGAPTVRILDTEKGLLTVEGSGPGRDLAAHEGDAVSATGVLTRNEDGEAVLRVSSFRTLGGP